MKGEAQVENERRKRVTNRVEIENDRDDAQEVEEAFCEQFFPFSSPIFAQRTHKHNIKQI